MALGWLGSNGGIGEAYRSFVRADIDAGISKYQTLANKVKPKYKPIFENIVSDLEGLLSKLEED